MIDSQSLKLVEEIGGPPGAALDRLIYVVGAARGGSSLMLNTIGVHNRVISTRGPTHFLNHVWRYRHRLHDRLWTQLLWTPEKIRRDFVRRNLSEARNRALTRLINRAVARKDLAELYRLYPVVRSLDPEEGIDPATAVAWLDKGNDFWGVEELSRAFPQARFVFIVRDPRGAIASLAKRVADRREDTEFVTESRDVIVSAIYWTNLAQQLLRFAAKHDDRAVIVRFEDLVRQPLQTVQMLFAALGLPPVEPARLEEKLDSVVYGASLDRAAEGKGFNTAPLDRWTKVLDARQLGLIAGVCGATAQPLGYDLRASGKGASVGDIVRCMSGLRGKALTLAKLSYLAARAPQPRAVPTLNPPPEAVERDAARHGRGPESLRPGMAGHE